MLLTAQAYADRLAGSGSNPAFHSLVVKRLAPLVRCPHLSQLWLSASVLSDDADKLLLGKQPQLKQLLLLKLASSTDASLSAEAVSKKIWSVPSSWLLPVRDIQPVHSARVDWQLDIAAIRQAALDSVSRQRTTILTSGGASRFTADGNLPGKPACWDCLHVPKTFLLDHFVGATSSWNALHQLQ